MTDIMASFEEHRERYLPAILEMVDQVMGEADLRNSSLAQMLNYQLETGGKRLRAILPLMVADALGCDRSKMIPLGAACELIHNATLVHDDLQDGDALRRGAPTIWKRFGKARAINLGDALLYLAPLCLKHVDVDEGRRWAVAERIFRDVLQVIDGQEREFELNGASVTRAHYERMVVGKTSGLFALPMAGAAQLCGAESRVATALDEAARHLGVIFQIQDDILDLYGDKGRQARGGDIREGKISILVVAFMEGAPPDEVERLLAILDARREETADADVAWAIESIRRRGALDVALKIVDERRRRVLAIEALSTYPKLGDLVGGLSELFLRPIEGL